MTTGGERLAVLARLLGGGRLTPTETEGLYMAPAAFEGLDVLSFVSLSREALFPPENVDWSFHRVLDGSGATRLLISPYQPVTEQLAQATITELPCYLVATAGATWPPGAFGQVEQIFEEALADAGLFFPRGELALNLLLRPR